VLLDLLGAKKNGEYSYDFFLRIIGKGIREINLVELTRAVTMKILSRIRRQEKEVEHTQLLAQRIEKIKDEAGEEDIISLLFISSLLYSVGCPVEERFLSEFGDVDDISECRERLEKILSVEFPRFWYYEPAIGLYHVSYARLIRKIFKESIMRRRWPILYRMMKIFSERASLYFITRVLGWSPRTDSFYRELEKIGLSEEEYTMVAYAISGRRWGTLLREATNDVIESITKIYSHVIGLRGAISMEREVSQNLKDTLKDIMEFYDQILERIVNNIYRLENLEETLYALQGLNSYMTQQLIQAGRLDEKGVMLRLKVVYDIIVKVLKNKELFVNMVCLLPTSFDELVPIVFESVRMLRNFTILVKHIVRESSGKNSKIFEEISHLYYMLLKNVPSVIGEMRTPPIYELSTLRTLLFEMRYLYSILSESISPEIRDRILEGIMSLESVFKMKILSNISKSTSR